MNPIVSTARTTCQPTAETGVSDLNEPIVEVAEECEVLFTQNIAILYDLEEQDGAKVVLENHQRFTAWAESLGVFRESHLSLDDNVRDNFDVKDQLLRLLDILQRNLIHLFEPDQSPKRMDIDSIDGDWSFSSSTKLSISSLEAISGAVDRLSTLGNLLQRSSLVSQSAKIRESTRNLHLKDFEKAVYLSLHSLYKNASQSLLQHLAESMAEMYARILQRKGRQALNAYRPRLDISDPLYLIFKDSAINISSYEEDLSTRLSNTAPGAAVIPPFSKTEHSELSPHFGMDPIRSYLHEGHLSNWNPLHILDPVDTAARGVRLARKKRLADNEQTRIRAFKPRGRSCQECRQKKKMCPHRLEGQEIRSKLNGPLKPGMMRVLENLDQYPRRPKNIIACDWCSSAVAADRMPEGDWRQHVNQDNEPYICLSEMCSKSLPKFSNSTSWLQHMLEIHGQNWHQEIHPPSLWICPLCTDWEVTFSNSDELNIHFETAHPGIFTHYQAQAVIQHSHIQTSRPQDSCPICCLPLKDGDDSTSKRNNASHSEMFVQDLPKDISSGSESGLEKIGSHVAAHLESIMVLALRLISINNSEDGLNDNESKSNDRLIWPGSWASSHKVDSGEAMGSLPSLDDDTSNGYSHDSNSTWDSQTFDPWPLSSSLGHGSEEIESDKRLSAPQPASRTIYFARALHGFQPTSGYELCFKADDIIELTQGNIPNRDGWFMGRVEGRPEEEGLVPKDYVVLTGSFKSCPDS